MNTDQLIEDLKRDEGFSERPYQDHLGYDTIGYGFLIDKRMSISMPREVADLWLRLIVEDRLRQLQTLYPWLDQQPEPVQRAVANMSYQLGVGGIYKFSKMLAALEAGDRKLAAVEAMDSKWAQQTPHRAKRIAEMIRGTA